MKMYFYRILCCVIFLAVALGDSKVEDLNDNAQNISVNANESVSGFNLTISEGHRNVSFPSNSKSISYGRNGKAVVTSFEKFLRSFIIGWVLKGSVSFFPKLLKSTRKMNPWNLLKKSFASIETIRFAASLAGFSGLYSLIERLVSINVVERKVSISSDSLRSIIGAVSGFLAGSSMLLMPKDQKAWLSQYLAVRAGQCIFQHMKTKYEWKRSCLPLNIADSGLFSVCSAQVMYAFIIRPECLPHSYKAFISRLCPTPEFVLDGVKELLRYRVPDDAMHCFDLDSFNARLQSEYSIPGDFLKHSLEDYQELIPCPLIHPKESNCCRQGVSVVSKVLAQSFFIYLPLYLIPTVLFRFNSLVRNPRRAFFQLIENTARSSCFMGCFVSSYQLISCTLRAFLMRFNIRDHRFFYWLTGFLASWAIFVEKKSRRLELALYVLPKSLDIVWKILSHRRYVKDVPFGLDFLFSISMAVNMAFLETDKSSMSPFLHKLLSFYMGREGEKNKKP